MHFANTSEILASLSDSLETDGRQMAHWLDLLVYHPDGDDLEHLFLEKD